VEHCSGRRETDELLTIWDVEAWASYILINGTGRAVDNQAVSIVIERRVAQRDRRAGRCIALRPSTDGQQNRRTSTSTSTSTRLLRPLRGDGDEMRRGIRPHRQQVRPCVLGGLRTEVSQLNGNTHDRTLRRLAIVPSRRAASVPQDPPIFCWGARSPRPTAQPGSLKFPGAPDAQTPRRSDAQTLRRSDAQTLRRSERRCPNGATLLEEVPNLIQRQHRQRQGQRRPEHLQHVGLNVTTRLVNHVAPRGSRQLHAQTKE
jgi:hypothetical protein